MINIYSVSTGCYSDYYEIIVTSETNYTKEGFLELINNICKDIISRDDYVGYASEIVDVMVKNHGFKRLQYMNCHAFDYSFGKKLFNDSNPDVPCINMRGDI